MYISCQHLDNGYDFWIMLKSLCVCRLNVIPSPAHKQYNAGDGGGGGGGGGGE